MSRFSWNLGHRYCRLWKWSRNYSGYPGYRNHLVCNT